MAIEGYCLVELCILKESLVNYYFAVRSEVFILMRRDIALAYRHPHYTHKMPEAPLAPLIWISLFLFL